MPHSSPPSDGTLIADVLAGKKESFALLVQRYEAALLRLANSRLGRADWAEDAVQETFLCAFKSLASYDSRYSFRTWLWTILLNQCRRQQKKHARRPNVRSWSDQSPSTIESSEQNRELPSGEAPPFAPLMRAEQTALLEAMLRRLPERQADALRLRFFGGLQFQEIADAMQCSLATAKNRVRWGLATLSQQISRQDAESLWGERPSPSGD